MSLRTTFVNIFRSKTRSLLTMAGIAVGVFSVVLISTVGAAGKEEGAVKKQHKSSRDILILEIPALVM